MNSAIDCCPIWDFDERSYRVKLEEAANGYRESTTTSFVDVTFFDFLDLSHTPKPTFEHVRAVKKSSTQASEVTFSQIQCQLPLPQAKLSKQNVVQKQVPQLKQLTLAQTQHVQSQQQLQVKQIVVPVESEEDSNNSIESPTPIERTPKKKEAITSMSMKLGNLKAQNEPKMRSPSSKNMEPVSPTNPQNSKKRKRASPKAGKVGEDGDYANEDSQISPTDESPNPQKKRRKNNGIAEGGQSECCVKDCHGSVTNRLRFSLRGTNEEDFKPDFLQREWQKICSKCYFRNFYKNKKR